MASLSPSIAHLRDNAYIKHVPSLYCPEQILQYLGRIQWSTSPMDVDYIKTFNANLENLTKLMLQHVLTFPVDNTDLHYTEEHHMPVAPSALFQRMVVDRKGSYCFGQNGLLLNVLRGLGYRVYPSAGRVLLPNPSPSPSRPEIIYTPLSHLTLLVQPHSGDDELKTYVVDVGFGGSGPLRPILLADGSEGTRQQADEKIGRWKGGWVWGTFPPERHRVIRGNFVESSLAVSATNSTSPPREWHMQVCHSPYSAPSNEGEKWTTLYTFTELEFFQWDIDAASFTVCTLPGQLFYHTLVCLSRFEVTLATLSSFSLPPSEEEAVKQIMEDEEKYTGSGLKTRWIGRWSLEGSKALKSLGSTRVEERILTSETERIEVLRTVFGIMVAEGSEKWIVGREAALPI